MENAKLLLLGPFGAWEIDDQKVFPVFWCPVLCLSMKMSYEKLMDTELRADNISKVG